MAAWLVAQNTLKIQPFKLPPLGPHDVRVRMKAVGICGSDVRYLKTLSCAHSVVKEPMVIDHECAGVNAKSDFSACDPRREVDAIGIFRQKNMWPLCLEFIRSGKMDVKPLITHRFGFSQKEAEDAFDQCLGRRRHHGDVHTLS